MKGINPYDFRPDQLINNQMLKTDYFESLYKGMGELSQQHFSCYPPFSVYLFGVCTIVSDDLYINVVIMHMLMLLFQIPGICFAKKICFKIGIDAKYIFLLFLHPLYLVEVFGNLHFEGVMVPLLFIFLYYLIEKLYYLSSLFLALAIHIKLIPILFLGGIFSLVSNYRWVKTSFLALLISFFLSIGLLNTNNVFNFLDSLQLYFGTFEFYSFLYVYFQQFNIQLYLTIIHVIILGVCVVWMKNKQVSWQNAIPIILIIYYLFSGTVHPWYLICVLLFAPFSRLKSVLIYPSLAFVSYLFYGLGDGFALRLIYLISYLIIISALFFDIKKLNAPRPKGLIY